MNPVLNFCSAICRVLIFVTVVLLPEFIDPLLNTVWEPYLKAVFPLTPAKFHSRPGELFMCVTILGFANASSQSTSRIGYRVIGIRVPV